ncbi:MAG TPA: hypothetical protein VL727_20550 [Puia sp.]|nr:hypothetical protein [Puia sp.]
MTSIDSRETAGQWTNVQKIAFRIAFIFFISISIPNSTEWYDTVIHIDWTRLNYRDLYDIARFGSGINIFGDRLFGSNLLGYANWIITLFIAILGGSLWTGIVRWRKTERQEYRTLYYWLRVVVRYRAGIGIIGFGFTKLLPVQMPYPGLGLLNTNFGDMTAQKIFWLSVGIVPWYQVFAGVVEVLAGSLLFFRKTTALGAILLFGALGDIVYVNFAYDGGVHVYSSYFVLLAGFLLVDTIPKVYNLLIRERDTVPNAYYPSFSSKWLRFTRFGLKSLTIFLFLGVLFYLQLINFLYDPYKQPAVAGVKTLRGNYAVTEFRLNNKLISYSPLDTVAWQEVEFEKWSSLSFTVNKPFPLDLSNGGGDPQRDVNRTFEITGVAGGRRVYHYYADTTDKVLYLEDKYKAAPDRRNRAAGVGGDPGAVAPDDGATVRGDGAAARDGDVAAAGVKAAPGKGKRKRSGSSLESGGEQPSAKATWDSWIPKEARAHIGNEVDQIDPRAASTRRERDYASAKKEKRNRMILKYDTIDGSRVVLTGINENKDSVYIVLDRINKNFALTESSLQAGKY